MLKRLFGRGKAEEKQPVAPAAPARARLWDAPLTPYCNYFALHLHGMTLDEAEQTVREQYLLHVEPGTVGALLAHQGAWVTAHMPESTVRGLGFNRLASFIARERETWVIGYRIFEWQGIDAHIFHGAEHVEQLAFAQNEIEFEPEAPALFADIADVSALMPRPATQHPLDFHFALLAALGIADAALTWEEAMARHAAGTLGASRLVMGSKV